MGVMARASRVVAALVVIMVLVSSTYASFAGYDGLPRPDGMNDKPTTVLGAEPAVKYDGKPANCTWYAWENKYYDPKDTKNCSSLLWNSLSQNADPESLEGFSYYAPEVGFFDPQYNQYLCVIGCFDLSATDGPYPGPSTSAPTAEPPVEASPPAMLPPPIAPPPTTPPMTPPAMAPSTPPAMAPSTPPAMAPSTPPAMAPSTPPAMPSSTPPPMMVPPPPATLFRSPPPVLPLPPSTVVAPAVEPSAAPGPPSETSAGGALRVFSASSVIVFVAALLSSSGLAF